MSIEVEPQPSHNRYIITVDGEQAGFTQYTDRGEQRVFLHTEIDQDYEGRGLGGTLVAGALADVRDSAKRAVAVCPFTVNWLRTHHDFDDIIDPVTIALRSSL
jgi:predicted GNAT family acetyltransferase